MDTTASSKHASSMLAPNPGKAMILALGHAFPQQLVMQDYVVDGFMKNTNCDDPELKEKLTRLCNNDQSMHFIPYYVLMILISVRKLVVV